MSMEGITGMIKMVVGDQLPENWAYCDGRLLKAADYPELTGMVQARFGGDGTEVIGIPNLASPPAGRYVICLSSTDKVKQDFKGLISQIALYVGQELPEGWMFCDGRVLPADRYPVLKTVMGKNYGGDGETTVGLPKMDAGMGVHYIMCVEGQDPRGEGASAEDDDDDY